MNAEAIRKAYARYAPLYDRWFGRILEHGRSESVRRMNCRSGDSVLEVGVGTGLSLPLYPPSVDVVGIDLSPEMLEKAESLVRRQGLANVSELVVMDAEQMSFPENRFDKVVAMYVASVVENPVRLVQEMSRVCKPDGDIFVVNHFQQTGNFLALMEKLLSPLADVIGFDPSFNLDRFVSQTNLAVVEKIPVNCFGYWTMLRAVNRKVSNSELQTPRPPMEKMCAGFYSSPTSRLSG